ncbi:MAG: hypothetical protein M4579_003497, partial [Chaenotheca gracillima]
QRYVDLRTLKPVPSGHGDSQSKESRTLTGIEWAFAGTSESTPEMPSRPAHTVWHHSIDSHSRNPQSDEGDMYPQPDGGVLEKGSMANPATGKVTDYEEMWDDEDVTVIGGDSQRVCVVLEMEHDTGGSEPMKGIVIRVGSRCHGLVIGGREGESNSERKVDLEKWVWKSESSSRNEGEGYDYEIEGKDQEVKGDDEVYVFGGEDEDNDMGAGGVGETTSSQSEPAEKKKGGWVRTAKIGDRFMPCVFAFEAGEKGFVKEGHTVEAGGATWTVTERHLW